MNPDARSTALSPAEALAQLPGPKGERFVTLFRRGTLEVEFYAPRGHDPQTPHRRDELYVVVSGHGEFVHDGRRSPFAPGDCLFVAAGVEHRFHAIEEDLELLVVFAPAET